MAEMVKQKIKLVTVHDRPLKTELGQYCNPIECADSSYESYQALSEKAASPFDI